VGGGGGVGRHLLPSFRFQEPRELGFLRGDFGWGQESREPGNAAPLRVQALPLDATASSLPILLAMGLFPSELLRHCFRGASAVPFFGLTVLHSAPLLPSVVPFFGLAIVHFRSASWNRLSTTHELAPAKI
jgi:hypothetical protein